MEKCTHECDILKQLPIAKRPNPKFVLSSNYGVSCCTICGNLFEARPDYEVEDRHGGGSSIDYKTNIPFLLKNYQGIYFDCFEEMITLRKSLGYQDGIDDINTALKDKVDLNKLTMDELDKYTDHPLEVVTKARTEYNKKLEAELKAQGKI